MKKVRVLVVDDSSVVRGVLTKALSRDPEIEVVGGAPDPYVARDMIVQHRPNVLTLDVEMPRMDGVTFLKKLMESYPLPILIVSGVTHQGCAISMEALEAGAIDVIAKPQITDDAALAEFGMRLCDQVKAAAQVRILPRRAAPAAPLPARKPVVTARVGRATGKLIALGASTGGTEAIKTVLERMPPDCPPIMIVQHMPGSFTRAFAERLNRQCPIEVCEAEDGMDVKPGRAIIANGNLHLVIRKGGPSGWQAETRDGPLVCRHKPSVEVLFRSFAKNVGQNAVGVMLTGMGRDGADGMKAMKDAGARTVAQDEKTCVVFGMPKEAIKAGAVDKVVPLDRVAETALSML